MFQSMSRAVLVLLALTLSASAAPVCTGDALQVESITSIKTPDPSDVQSAFENEIAFRTPEGETITLLDRDGLATVYVLYYYWIEPAFRQIASAEKSEIGWQKVRDRKVVRLTKETLEKFLSASRYFQERLYDGLSYDKPSIEWTFARSLEEMGYFLEEHAGVSYERLNLMNVGFLMDQVVQWHPAYDSKEGGSYKILQNSSNNPIGSAFFFHTLQMPYFDISKCGTSPVFAPKFPLK